MNKLPAWVFAMAGSASTCLPTAGRHAANPLDGIFSCTEGSCCLFNDGIAIVYVVALEGPPALKDMEAVSSKACAVPSVLAAYQADWGSGAAAIRAVYALQSVCDISFTALIFCFFSIKGKEVASAAKERKEPLRRMSKK